MNQQSYQAITAMLNAFPQSGADIRGLLLTYEHALAGLPERAISETAVRFIQGTVPGQNMTFAPAVPEFVRAARWQEEFISARAKPRLPAPAPESRRGSLAPFEVTRNRLLAANAHLPVLHENVSLDDFRILCTSKQLPRGSKYVAALGRIYGLAEAAAEQARAA